MAFMTCIPFVILNRTGNIYPHFNQYTIADSHPQCADKDARNSNIKGIMPDKLHKALDFIIATVSTNI